MMSPIQTTPTTAQPGGRWRFARRLLGGVLMLAMLLSLLGAPQPPAAPAPGRAWAYEDVIGLDPADAAEPQADLLAVYVRRAGDELEIRLDLLAHGAAPLADIYLALDVQPGGHSAPPFATPRLPAAEIDWDTWLVIPANAPLQVLDGQGRPQSSTGLSVWREPRLDALILRLRLAQRPLEQRLLDPAGRLQVFSVLPGQSGPANGGTTGAATGNASGAATDAADASAVFGLLDPPPPPARLLLAFSDTYPAFTPAIALRRWSGAHTGPQGGSHGLGHLLRAARQTQLPLLLLDLTQPEALSALDYSGHLALVQAMQRDDLLLLPGALPVIPSLARSPQARQRQVQAARSFGLAGMPLLYSATGALPAGLPPMPVLTLAPGPASSALTQPWRDANGRPWLALPAAGSSPAQVTGEGLSEAVRALAAQAAAQAGAPGAAPILVLGGSLPQSEWGNPALARAGLRDIKSHPWMQVLGPQGLLDLLNDAAWMPDTAPPVVTVSDGPSADAGPSTSDGLQAGWDSLYAALQAAPANAVTQAAWEAYFALAAPVYPAAERLPALRAAYQVQVWSLLHAAGWAEQGYSTAACLDIDRDGQDECVLANAESYLQFETPGGYLSFAFWRDPRTHQVHQWVGPSSQMGVGYSDAARWRLANGQSPGSDAPADALESDPTVIPGAFYEPGVRYEAHFVDDELIFSRPDGQGEKRFSWSGSTFYASYHLTETPAAGAMLALLLDPAARFSVGWSERYRAVPDPTNPDWQLDGGLRVSMISMIGTPEIHGFNATRSLFESAENPELAYPAEHFLPFPLAVVTLPLHSGDNYFILTPRQSDILSQP